MHQGRWKDHVVEAFQVWLRAKPHLDHFAPLVGVIDYSTVAC